MIDHLTSTLASSPLSLRSPTARLDSLVSRYADKKPARLARLSGFKQSMADTRAVPYHFVTRAARNRAIDVAAQHETGLYTHEISAISEAA